MHVSKEMVDRLEVTLCNGRAFGVPTRGELERGLCAALADVPEPDTLNYALRQASEALASVTTRIAELEAMLAAFYEETAGLQLRIAELEAQLARVLEVATEVPHQPLGMLFVLGILDGKEAPHARD